MSIPNQIFSICIMEAFFQENRDSYIKQVATFQPSQNQAKDAGGELREEDTVIAARVRPLLPNEVNDGEVIGISVRPEARYADVHELRRKINGQPRLNSSSFRLHRSMDRIRHLRMSTRILLHRYYHGRGEVELVLCLRMGRPDLEKRTV